MKRYDTDFVIQCIETHKSAFEDWPHGDAREAWVDDDGNLCIRYEDGMHYHYKEENGSTVWW